MKTPAIQLILTFLLCGPGFSSLPGPVLDVAGELFLLDEKPFEMWGVRVASASQNRENTRSLISCLDDYKASGINCFSVFLQGSSGGYSGPSGKGGSSIERSHFKRLTRIIRECARREMVVIMGIFTSGR